MAGEIVQLPDGETLLSFIVGDALRFEMTVLDPDPASPDPENPNMIPRNLTGWTAKCQIRKTVKVADPILAEFTFNTLDPTGVIQAYLSPTESSKLEGLASGRWDFQITDPSGDPDTIMRGPARPVGQVSR
jgi:hypothetical protein